MNDIIVFEQKYSVTSINVNSNKRLGLLGVLGFIQDIASEHALEIGFGIDEMKTNGVMWVLIRQKLKMLRWASWQETVTIRTWSKPVQGLYAFREFEIFVGDEKIGECSTTWMILDMQTRRPVNAEFINEISHHRYDYSLDFSSQKVELPDHFSEHKSFEVRNSDIDMNNHVNNIKYAQWSLDSIPFDYHKNYIVEEYEINFIGETFLGDIVNCFNNIDNGTKESYFKGLREKDGKLVFAARIKAKKL